MLQQNILKISEIFFSSQGEGLRVGEPTIFVRLSGCNVRCKFCDTKYAWNKGKKESVERILKRIERFKNLTKWVCITGGEPTLQDISNLVINLKNSGYFVQIETNGRKFLHLPFDWVTLSPKPPDYKFDEGWKGMVKEVKLVVDKELKIDIVKKISESFSEIPIFLQPQSMLKWSIKKAYQLWKKGIKMGLENLRLGYQIQKIYRIK